MDLLQARIPTDQSIANILSAEQFKDMLSTVCTNCYEIFDNERDIRNVLATNPMVGPDESWLDAVSEDIVRELMGVSLDDFAKVYLQSMQSIAREQSIKQWMTTSDILETDAKVYTEKLIKLGVDKGEHMCKLEEDDLKGIHMKLEDISKVLHKINNLKRSIVEWIIKSGIPEMAAKKYMEEVVKLGIDKGEQMCTLDDYDLRNEVKMTDEHIRAMKC